MKAYQFKGLLQNDYWIIPAFVRLDERGLILSISKSEEAGIDYTMVNGYALPGMPNAHSHAFQYAMVGLTEQHDLTHDRDDFWGWRKAMYQLALSIDPDQMEAIATMLYAELLRHGYTQVAEFHYLHHSPSGKPYSNVAELGERLIVAAKNAGIKITLIPIFYQKGGFGQAAIEEQRRFVSSDIAHYLRLLEASRHCCRGYPDARVAFGVHSLRAVEPAIIKELTQIIDKDLPFHIHVAEQLKEVEAALAYLGKRPVEWMAENIELNSNYHLVHATHLTSGETRSIARSQANVVLCPSTEGNLGDGLFRLREFQQEGGNWSIGTDSHIGLNPFEELRILDYGQRVTSHQRNIYYAENQGNSGLFALQKAIATGRQAMGDDKPVFFKTGAAFDALVMDAEIPVLAVCAPENLASTVVYASDVSMHLGTMVNGEWRVQDGKHHDQEKIAKQFVAALRSLKVR